MHDPYYREIALNFGMSEEEFLKKPNPFKEADIVDDDITEIELETSRERGN